MNNSSAKLVANSEVFAEESFIRGTLLSKVLTVCAGLVGHELADLYFNGLSKFFLYIQLLCFMLACSATCEVEVIPIQRYEAS